MTDYQGPKGPRTSDILGTIFVFIIGGGGVLYLLTSVFPAGLAALIAFVGVYIFVLSR